MSGLTRALGRAVEVCRRLSAFWASRRCCRCGKRGLARKIRHQKTTKAVCGLVCFVAGFMIFEESLQLLFGVLLRSTT